MATVTAGTTPTRGGIAVALAPVAALLLGSGMLFTGFGLQTTLVPLRADVEGFSNFSIGLLGSAYYAGFVFGCIAAPYLILRAGHIRAFAAMVSTLSAAILAFPMLIGEVQWMLFRVAIGFCISGLLVIIESWLNDKATNTTRGVVMSAYIIVNYATITVGQLLVTIMPLSSFALFSICSVVLSLAAVPVALTRSTQPAPIPVVNVRPWRLYTQAPAAFVGVFVSGLITGSVLSLGAIFATSAGFTTSEAAVFVAAIMIGGAIGQYPFGRASDFVDRRLVLFVSSVATVVACAVIALMTSLPALMVLAMGGVVGLVLLPGYALAVAHAYDRTEPDSMVETGAGVILVYGVGSIFGPLISSLAMDVFGPAGLFLFSALASGLLALFIAVRIFARARARDAQRSDFDIYSTAPVGGALTPEPMDADDPALQLPEDYAAPIGLSPDHDETQSEYRGDAIAPATVLEPEPPEPERESHTPA